VNFAGAIRLLGEMFPQKRTAERRTDSRSSWSWAVHALRRELLGFRFDYPIEAVPEAAIGPSLHYHIASDRLFLEELEFDANGVAMRNYRARGRQYNPVFVAWWGLVNLEWYLRRSDEECLEKFFTQVKWLRASAVERQDGAIVWPCYFDWQEGHCRLRAPWISAMYQGLVISTLVRAYRITGDRDMLALCEKGARVFERTLDQGGVRTVEHGYVLYEEYPGYPLARVLDGFLFSLLGLYDLQAETRDPRILRLFAEGLEGLTVNIEFWNYRNKWSWYGSHRYLCPTHYHKLNCVLLSVLGNLTGNEMLRRYAALWDMKTLSLADEGEIFLVFTITKNWARLRLPRH
jgi:D-glucuronyl C5-epimerase-like protein